MKGLRRLLLVAAATAGLVLSLTGCSKSVDFLQYADVTFDGINGQATATVNVDYNKIGTDVFGKGKSQTDMDEARTETAMMGEVNYEVTPSENLSNGDTVTLSVEISDYFQKEYKVTAKAASKEIAEAVGLQVSRTKMYLAELIEQEAVVAEGAGRARKYRLKT